MTNKTNLFDIICKLIVFSMLVYVGWEMRGIKTAISSNKTEISFTTLKLDYVTSDINLHKNYDNIK